MLRRHERRHAPAAAKFDSMNLLHRCIKGVDAVNDWIGRTVAWLTLGCVLTCFTVVVLRYAFNVGFPWMQELYVWQHAAVFMAGAGYTMLHRGHVNVDVMYGRLSDRGRAWIDILGTVFFLFPWLAILAVTSAPFVLSSWSIREASATADGMPGLYLLKSLLWVLCALLFVQGLALVARRSLSLAGHAIVDHDEDKVTDERI
jgi:TRAP-type mannitol/chloroaromatic compound transport system permease small subunit